MEKKRETAKGFRVLGFQDLGFRVLEETPEA